MKKFFFDCGTREAAASLGLLALRILTGLMMLFGHGIPKLMSFASRKDYFPVPQFFPLKYMTPPISLMTCIGAEIGAASLVIIGFATRPAAFTLAFCMIVAAFEVLSAAPWFQNSPTLVDTKELSVMYLIPMIAIILAGAGGYSLDALIHKEGKRRRW